MLRALASLLIAIGLAFAPAMMAQVSAAPVTAMEHCKGALPAKHQGKTDTKPCCSTACPMTAALPAQTVSAPMSPAPAVRLAALLPVFYGLDPEKDTPPPRNSPAI